MSLGGTTTSSAIRYVTPNQRHRGEDASLLKQRARQLGLPSLFVCRAGRGAQGERILTQRVIYLLQPVRADPVEALAGFHHINCRF